MSDAISGGRLTAVLASPDPEPTVRTFLEEHEVPMTTLLDTGGVYRSYDRDELGESEAPYPLHVVIDGEGVVRYLSTESDPAEVVAELTRLLGG